MIQTFHADDGATLAYRDEGKGLPLLALAGLTRDGRDFDYFARCVRSGIRLIRLDSRGRGFSAYTGPATYTVAQEAKDAIALLDHLNIERTAVLGSSRGGLLAMVLAATTKHRLCGVCFNDVGPVLERDGLLRIGQYIGVPPAVDTLEEIADRMPGAMAGFHHVSTMRWAEEAIRHFVQSGTHVELTYDPTLRVAFDEAMSKPLQDAWPLFEACSGLPLALIRGANSDVLSKETAFEMMRRRPDIHFSEVPDRGHIPFLDEVESIECIQRWLEAIADDLQVYRPSLLANRFRYAQSA